MEPLKASDHIIGIGTHRLNANEGSIVSGRRLLSVELLWSQEVHFMMSHTRGLINKGLTRVDHVQFTNPVALAFTRTPSRNVFCEYTKKVNYKE